MVAPIPSVNAPNLNGGDMPLHTAARAGSINAVNAFLKKKTIEVNPINIQGDTPLHLAAQGGHFDVVQALLKKGAKANFVNKKGKTAKDLAEENEHTGVVKILANPTQYWNRTRYGTIWENPKQVLLSPSASVATEEAKSSISRPV